MKNTMYKTLIIIFCSFLAVVNLYAQMANTIPKLVFENDSVYMGRIQAKDGLITQRFDFKVLPGQYATIQEVKPDCACSVATYPKAPLEGGDFAYIMVTFSPYKMGPFEKRFAVIFADEGNGQEVSPMELVIKGYIAPEKPDIALDFPYKCGNLRLKTKLLSFGGIGHATLVKQRIQLYNDSDYPIAFTDSVDLPAYIELVLDTPRIVAPHSLCEASVFYHPELKNNFGHSYDNIRLYSDDPAQPVLELDVTAVIRPEEHVKTNNSPILWMNSTEIDLGKITEPRDFVVSFMLYNRGEEDLVIKKAVPKENLFILSLDKEVVKKGEFAILKVQVTGLTIKGSHKRSLSVYTNDPVQHIKELKVVAEVP